MSDLPNTRTTARKGKSKKSESPFDFESSMEELEGLVQRLEQGDSPLEESLEQFERGVQLIRSCRQALESAEQKVEILTREGLEPFADKE